MRRGRDCCYAPETGRTIVRLRVCGQLLVGGKGLGAASVLTPVRLCTRGCVGRSDVVSQLVMLRERGRAVGLGALSDS